MSTVRSLPTYEIDKRPSIDWLKTNLGFIIDHHQINVALTRAKRGLIIVGKYHSITPLDVQLSSIELTDFTGLLYVHIGFNLQTIVDLLERV